MKFTGERMIPGASPGDLEKIHRARYALAERVIREKHGTGVYILDAPCGTGYGTAMLARVGKAYGADCDPVAIDYAKEYFGRPGKRDGCYLTYTECEVLNVIGATVNGFVDVFFDAIVCLEGIEHVEEDEGRAWIDGFAAISNSGASLIISTPNPTTSKSNDKFHKREYMPTELRDMVEAGGDWKVVEGWQQSRNADLAILRIADLSSLPYVDDDQVTDFIILRAERVGT